MVYFPSIKLLDPLGAAFPKAEDAPSASGDYGVPILSVRKDTPTALAGADGDYAFIETDNGGRIWITGQGHHDSVISGASVRIGGRARSGSDITAVSADDAVDAIFDSLGKQIVLPYTLPANYQDGVTAAITGTSDTAVIAAPGASLFLNITAVLVTNSHATVGTVVELKSSTTVRARGYAAALGGGFFIHLPTPMKLASNQAFNAANITTGSNTYVTAWGYISAN